MPPRSTKAPKLTTLDTTPLRTSPGLRLCEEVLALLLLRLLEVGAAGEHDVVAVLVELDDLRLQHPADVGLEVAHAAQLDEAGGQEAAQADVEDEAALDDLDDRALDDAVGVLDLLDRAPRPLVLRPLLRQDETTFLVLLLEDERLDVVAQRHDLVRVDVVADRQLARRDDAFGLVADVEQDLVLVDLHHRALHDLAVLDVDEGAVDRIGERHAEIVCGDLAGVYVPSSAKVPREGSAVGVEESDNRRSAFTREVGSDKGRAGRTRAGAPKE